MNRIDIYIESASKRVFACAVDWPGWSRSGPDVDAAIGALVAYAERYQRAIRSATRATVSGDVNIIERLTGGASTDFGVPAMVSSNDLRPLNDAELATQRAILRSCWDAFDAAVSAVSGIALRTGPRGGGRDLAKMVAHFVEAEASYVGMLGGAVPHSDGPPTAAAVHEAFEAALAGRIRGELPAKGPRGGLRWPPRYAIRRAAWHALDHAWELEDRARPPG